MIEITVRPGDAVWFQPYGAPLGPPLSPELAIVVAIPDQSRPVVDLHTLAGERHEGVPMSEGFDNGDGWTFSEWTWRPLSQDPTERLVLRVG